MNKTMSSGIAGKLTKGLTFGILMFFGLFSLSVLLVSMTPLPERLAPWYLWICLSLASGYVGMSTGYHCRSKGFLAGGLISLAFLLLLLSGMGVAFVWPMQELWYQWKILLPLLTGSIGGIIGVNLNS